MSEGFTKHIGIYYTAEDLLQVIQNTVQSFQNDVKKQGRGNINDGSNLLNAQITRWQD